MSIKTVRVVANCDVATIVWKADPITDCRGFALEREVKGKAGTTFLPTWVGFRGQKHKEGESRSSTEWPIQRYIWSDFDLKMGQEARYRVVPMVGPASGLDKADAGAWSDWTEFVAIETEKTRGFKAYFNRGIVPSQWMARQKPSKKSLQADLDDPHSKNRIFLSGCLRTALLDLLTKARTDGVEIYAALYELNDPEVIAALKLIGGKCKLILASGAYKAADKKTGAPAEPDENAAVREDLQLRSSINVYDRLVKSPHFAHNKFVVFCDKNGEPATLWTGSTNLTETGLCTQVNNGILIRSPELAETYRARWEELKDAGATYPASLALSENTHAQASVAGVKVTAWNAPVEGLIDLAAANLLIRGAQQGVLFLMFNPGPNNTLLNTILELDAQKLFVHGVVNQDPGGKKAPLLTPYHQGKELAPANLRAVLPAGLEQKSTWFDKTFAYNRVMIHSKVVVIDPFGDKPVVITGSHNLGPKASRENDDNMVIIEGAPGLAAEYAVNIMGVYGHYKWLYNRALKKQTKAAEAIKTSPQYDGNYDHDQWQKWYTSGMKLREINFWLGQQ